MKKHFYAFFFLGFHVFAEPMNDSLRSANYPQIFYVEVTPRETKAPATLKTVEELEHWRHQAARAFEERKTQIIDTLKDFTESPQASGIFNMDPVDHLAYSGDKTFVKFRGHLGTTRQDFVELLNTLGNRAVEISLADPATLEKKTFLTRSELPKLASQARPAYTYLFQIPTSPAQPQEALAYIDQQKSSLFNWLQLHAMQREIADLRYVTRLVPDGAADVWRGREELLLQTKTPLSRAQMHLLQTDFKGDILEIRQYRSPNMEELILPALSSSVIDNFRGSATDCLRRKLGNI